MKRSLLFRWLCLGPLAALAACGSPAAEVNFAQPFPAGVPDLSGFKPAHCGRYAATSDPTTALLLSEKLLVRQDFLSNTVTAHQLDSLGLPAQAGLATGRDARHYQVQPLAADSFRLRWEQRDTLLALGPEAHLRRYKGWYYCSAPSDASPGTWAVQRLAVAGRQLLVQQFNPDTLRIQALDPGTVQVRRAHGRQVFTLTPPNGRAIRQVNAATGLWLGEVGYVRQ